eukprot:SAG11_NODE_4903_length_1728_cov_2.362799_2_plen_67_part_00
MLEDGDGDGAEIDARLGRLPGEKVFPKRFASCFAGTALEKMLTKLRVDTVIVLGVSELIGCCHISC